MMHLIGGRDVFLAFTPWLLLLQCQLNIRIRHH
jgi:hypothetical protein